MAQAPATAKWRRFALLVSARLGGTGWVRQQSSERAALVVRAKGLQSGKKHHVTFLIPLVGPHHVQNWEAVQARLATTLHSFMVQDDPNWRAVICCQTRPDLPQDPRITFLPFDDPTPGNDKWRKLRALYQHLPKTAGTPGYVMSFDADDLLRQGTVSEMLNRQLPGGYLVEAGLVMDHTTGQVALANTRSLAEPFQKPFWKLCGSCAAVSWDPARPDVTKFLLEMTAHEHRMFPYLARLAGLRLSPLRKPSVLYVLNHGENFGARRGRVGFKTRFVERFALPEALTAELFPSAFPFP